VGYDKQVKLQQTAAKDSPQSSGLYNQSRSNRWLRSGPGALACQQVRFGEHRARLDTNQFVMSNVVLSSRMGR
jgi:hypothetical protein